MKKISVFLFDLVNDEAILIDNIEVTGFENQISGKISQIVQKAQRNHRFAGQLFIQTRAA